MTGFVDALRRFTEAGRPVAVATVVRASGSVPRQAGAKMIVAADGETWETVGGGAFEARVVADALDAIAAGDARLKRYTFTETGAESVGQVCGGSVEVFLEPVLPQERLLILGAGHVGQALARHAAGLGFETIVVDDRAAWLRTDQFPAGVRLIETDETYTLRMPAILSADYIAVLTRCHRTDRNALAAALAAQPRYLGLICSRRKKLRLFAELEAQGVARERLETIHAPIGLPIGAETPAEIAVAIAGEIVRERRSSQPEGAAGAAAAAGRAREAEGTGTD